MTDNICACHCGTRIDLDEQLLEEREMWKEKYNCLQRQVKIDFDAMKDNIYAECANIMQQEFSGREAEHNKIVNQKNIEIKDLIARVINLEANVKVLEKQKELGRHSVRELETDLESKDALIALLKGKEARSVRDWELKHEEELVSLRKRVTASNQDQLDSLETDNEHLKHKVKQFEQKYQRMIPEVEKLKNALTVKSTQVDELQDALEKTRKSNLQTVNSLRSDLDDLTKIHATCSRNIRNLETSNQQLQKENERCQKVSKEVRVEAVYIDRPVEVEKVVEKVIEVEKVVKKFIENPNGEQLSSLQEQNKKLKSQVNSVLGEIKEMEQHFEGVVQQLQANAKVYEDNIEKYKREREHLAQQIAQQNREIEMLQNYIQQSNRGKIAQKSEGEKIVVHVKQDGTYEKHVEKVSTHTNKRKR